jgi:UDP-N-acetylmuramoylalanine--D-glutamate ligase
MGLGRHGGGVAAVQFLVHRGARVTVTDSADERSLSDSVTQVADLPLAGLHLGGHCERHFREADLIVVSPAVRPDNPFVRSASRSGVPITSEIELFLRCCPAKVVGVTGSSGKSTTAAMIAAIGQAAGRQVWLGGNIERSLLPMLDNIDANDVVVLELSSFQLAWLSPSAPRPSVAVITQCEPNHLDWHGTFQKYLAAKQRIIDSRHGHQTVVLGHGIDHRVWEPGVRGKLLQPWPSDTLPPLAVPGEHNRHNAGAAAAAAKTLGCDSHAVRTGLSSFSGLPHRLETIGRWSGRRFVNDTQATTPEATIAALRTISEPCWLLAGGADKGAAFDHLADAIVQRARGAAFYGQVAPDLFTLVTDRRPNFACLQTATLGEAFDWCWQQSNRGDAIVLSPACSSLDQYRDYADRANHFLECATGISAAPCHHQRAADLV